MQEFFIGPEGYRNILGQFGPEEGPRIVVGAHYDAFRCYPAADDNASAVAGLIELAYLLGQEDSLPVTVELVGYTLEEPPIKFFTKNSHLKPSLSLAMSRHRCPT